MVPGWAGPEAGYNLPECLGAAPLLQGLSSPMPSRVPSKANSDRNGPIWLTVAKACCRSNHSRPRTRELILP